MNQDRSTTITNSQLKEGYKQTEVGLIPEDWEVKRLKHISPSQSVGLVINPSSYFDNGGTIPMLVGSHINENRIDWESANRISEFSNNLLPSSRLAAGDLVTVRVGDPGLTAVIPSELDGCNCASMMIIRQHRSFVSRWLCYVMNSRSGRSQIEHVQYGTAQKQFNISDAVDFSYPVPPLAEQEAIASTLSDIDALIESLDRLLIKKRQIKQGAMQELLRSKDGWIEKSLGEVADFFKGKGLPKSAIIPFATYPCIHYGELFTKYPETILNIQSRTNINTGVFYSVVNDVLMPTSDVTPNGLATASCILDDGVILGGDVLVIRIDPKKLNGSFLSYLIRYSKKQIMQLISGTTVYHLYGSDMRKFSFSMPPIEEQIEIANILSDMDAEIESISAKLTKTRQLKQGMMHELLTGRIRLVDNSSIS